MTEVTEEGFKPPYMAFQTFWKFIEDLASRPLPPVIDRSMMNQKSGTDQANLRAALRAFDLIDDENKVQPGLNDLTVEDPESRKVALEKLVRVFYAAPLAVSDQHGTEQQLHDCFRDTYGQSAAETRRKSETFFLHAARAAGIELSTYFPTTRSGSGAPGGARPRKPGPKKRATASGSGAGGTGAATPSDPGDKYRLEVTLKTGGTMTLTVSVDPLRLRGDDRDFFYSIVDTLSDYDGGHPERSVPDGG